MFNRDKVDLLNKIEEAAHKSVYAQQQFWLTGDAAIVAFEVTKGWKPLTVFSTAGALLREGAADDYTVTEHHGTYTVTFAAAPSAADFCIVGELL